MQNFTTDEDFSCSIKFLHESLKIVSAKIKVLLIFWMPCIIHVEFKSSHQCNDRI